jgi:hypothetical protein
MVDGPSHMWFLDLLNHNSELGGWDEQQSLITANRYEPYISTVYMYTVQYSQYFISINMY